MKKNSLLMQEAREALRGKWGLAVGGSFLYMVIGGVANFLPKIGGIVLLIIAGPLLVGFSTFVLFISRKQDASIDQLFVGFNDFIRSFLAYLMMIFFILLWSLLLIIPGIIASFAYSQTFFILAEDNSISARDAIRKSKLMMNGNKSKLFFLSLRFLGWAFLCILTFGIGLLWLFPYIQVTMAKFYDDVSGKLKVNATEELKKPEELVIEKADGQ